ncbi:MAG: NAD-dependent epimerase/dehydratase family protein [Candidatus Poribacteria bacterium]
MRVVVVGGTGNISTSIVRELLALDHDVTVYNRGQSGDPPDGVRVIRGDRQDRDAFEAAMGAEQFDAAIDMICFNAEDAATSVRAFRDVSHFVQCSTTATYGIEADILPVPEHHPLRPITDYGRGKVAADDVYLTAFHRDAFPATIIKPSTTYGPKMGLLRQVAWEFTWIDRIRKGKPLLVAGDGRAIHQFLHVDDAGVGFANLVGKEHTVGQMYNLVRREHVTWVDHHKTAMRVLGREVELVGVPIDDLVAMGVERVEICRDIFGHNAYYSGEKISRDVPEFRPRVSLADGMRHVIDAMDADGRVPNSDDVTWEDTIIAAQRAVREPRVS